MRLLVQLANLFVGVPVDKAGEEVLCVMADISQCQRRDAFYNRTKYKPLRDLREQPGDGARLWALTERLLQPWRSAK